MARSIKPELDPDIVGLAEDPMALENPNASEAIEAWNALVIKFDNAGPLESHIIKEQLYHAAARVYYEGESPKDVPLPGLLFMLKGNPPAIGIPQGPFEKARQRIRGPQQAIRAFCVNCQGDEYVGVRDCPSVTCPFWPFRMGNNPFFGKIPGAEAAAEAETEEELNADIGSVVAIPDEGV